MATNRGDREPILSARLLALSEDDNVLVQGILGSPYAMGFFGYAYYIFAIGLLLFSMTLTLNIISRRIVARFALDPISTLRIEELIQELKKNYTILIVTHNRQQAARASDYTAFLNMDEDRAGYLVEYGETDQIFTNPQHELTEQYITGRFG